MAERQVVFQAQIDDVVAEQAADEKFKRQVVDTLHIVLVMGLLGGGPAIDKTVADGEGEREVAIAVCGAVAVFGQSAAQMALEVFAKLFGRCIGSSACIND